ncbi:gamma-glutamyl-gamma-aminobutyrate hydrolase family protein (plasmid) [Halarchaeum sp. CBA1220]|uniref:type 1 glutamine amidotransferase n=1 Tax=Halarchaeum sp. CBA1220 TaxID=1853682 RepID=UPI000F3AA45B|nr:gamma-glutamyl-gamma-aminobutyrate hydrolase family protein [Halarchaeum sp. CBA1220]QLC35347.1 gamma-glutamyl-gamma-aminobutyrate hydrolase family protein [Halarchaeum sp. CBA1220]
MTRRTDGARRDPERSLYLVRNEVDPELAFHYEALARHLPDATVVDYPDGERFEPADADAVVLSGSTAGVYESGGGWIEAEAALVRDLVAASVPTLGICFGHQIANAALGGTVEHAGMTAGLVEASLADVPLFDGVEPVVPVLHGDVVVTPGESMAVVASASHARVLATRHEHAPLWTVQFHPELTSALRARLVGEFEWRAGPHAFADATTERVLANFQALTE